MGRLGRLDAAGVFFHVMARGNNREAIFRERGDFITLLRIIESSIRRFDRSIHAYCLMTNHIHLLLRGGQPNLSRFMEHVLGSYARVFNRHYGRVGHVFQARFLSKPVLSEAYLHQVGRYIHMNPVAAGLVRAPGEYPWSSYHEYRQESIRGLVRTDALLAPFTGPGGRDEFVRYTVEGELRVGDARGWPGGVQWYGPEAQKSGAADVEDGKASRPQEVLGKAVRLWGLRPDALRRAWRHPRMGEAKAIAMLALRCQTDLTLREIGELVGVNTPASVCRRLGEIRRRLPREPRLQTICAGLGPGFWWVKPEGELDNSPIAGTE